METVLTITYKRTDAKDADFIQLVQQLDAELAERDGPEHVFYAQHNFIHSIPHVVVAYQKGIPVACGAIKHFEENIVEVKRMFTLPAVRGRGIAAKVLLELEQWARELGNKACVLETGVRQPEAIRLYEKSGYQPIPNYGQYEGIINSVCFKKNLV